MPVEDCLEFAGYAACFAGDFTAAAGADITLDFEAFEEADVDIAGWCSRIRTIKEDRN